MDGGSKPIMRDLYGSKFAAELTIERLEKKRDSGDWSDSERDAVRMAKLRGLAWIDEIQALGRSTFV